MAEQRPAAFNPNDHLMQLKSKEGAKDYLPVQWRLVWFRSLCPDGTIDTEEIMVDLDKEVSEEAFVWNSEKRKSEKVIKTAKGYARFKATITDGKGGRATGTKSESAASFADYIEKAETGAIGRALAALGYGTQFAPELNEEHRLADSPVDRASDTSNGNEPVASPHNPLDKAKTNAIKVGFITGQTKEQLKASWEEQIIQIFGSRISDVELAKPANLARFNGSIEAFSRQKEVKH